MVKRIGFALARFKTLPTRRKLIYAEVCVFLIAAWGLVRAIQFKQWRSLLKQSRASRSLEELAIADLDFLADLQHVLRQLKWSTRDRATCLMMVLVARWMLNRRKIPGTIFLGVRRGSADLRLHAHAWLVSAIGVVGHEDIDLFTVVERING